MEKAGLILLLCVTPLFHCLPTTRSDSDSNSDSSESFGLGYFFKGYRLEEAIDTALTKVEQHDMEIEELRREIGQIGDILERQSFLLRKLQDLMQIEDEDIGYQDDPGSEQVDSDDVESDENPPPQLQQQTSQQSSQQTKETLEDTEESVADLENAMIESEEENTSESPESAMSNEIPLTK